MNPVSVPTSDGHLASQQSENALESVIHRSEMLSPAERLILWQHLAQLPDSGIESTDDVRSLIRDHWMGLGDQGWVEPPKEQEWKQIGFFGLKRTRNTVIASIDGTEVMRVTFKPQVFAKLLFQTLPVRQPTEHDMVARTVQKIVIEAKRKHIAARFTEKLPLIVGMVLDNLIRAFALEGSNMLFEQAGEGKKFSADKIHEMVFRHDWAHLKPMLAIRRGAPEGRRGYTQAERDAFLESALAASRELRKTKAQIKKIDLARKLFARHANPLRELNRRLTKYQLDFGQLVN